MFYQLSMKIYKLIFIIVYVTSEIIVMLATDKWATGSMKFKVFCAILFCILNAVVIFLFQNSCRNIESLGFYNDLTKDDSFEVLNPQAVDIKFSGIPENIVPFGETDIKFSDYLFNNEYTADFIVKTLNKNIFDNIKIVSVSTAKNCIFYIPKEVESEITLLYLLTETGANYLNFTENYIDITFILNSIINSDTENYAVLFAQEYGKDNGAYKIFAVAKSKELRELESEQSKTQNEEITENGGEE